MEAQTHTRSVKSQAKVKPLLNGAFAPIALSYKSVACTGQASLRFVISENNHLVISIAGFEHLAKMHNMQQRFIVIFTIKTALSFDVFRDRRVPTPLVEQRATAATSVRALSTERWLGIS